MDDITKWSDFDSNTEYWRVCIDNPEYEVSTFGNVRKSEQKIYAYPENEEPILLKAIPSKLVHKYKGKSKDYYMVTLGSMQISVHRLVAMNFLKNPYNKKCIVHHKDENKLNNHVENLEYITYEETKKSNFVVETAIKCITTNEYFSSIKAVSLYFNIPYVHVQRYLQRKSSDIPKYWTYPYEFVLVSKEEVRESIRTKQYVKVDTVNKNPIKLK